MDDEAIKRHLAQVEKRAEERLHREDIVQRVRDLAGKGKIYFGDHAFERIDERGIDAVVALRILKDGDLKNDLVEAGDEPDQWTLTMVSRVKENRDVGVVTVVVGKKFLRVITVEWEDLK